MKLFKILLFLIIANQAESLLFGKIISMLRNKKVVSVQTKNGALYGYRHDNPAGTPLVKFWTFLGVPYAKPPVLQRRFKDPDTNLIKMPRFAVYPRPGCVTGTGQNIQGVEDCLYLNIFSPVNPDPTMLMAVMVWFHGGAFFAGTGNLPLEYTYSFLESGIILVSVHYRLGAFGFLCTEDSASPGNYGIKDQIAALKWIKTNIRNFGGDPNRITIFGESAGAASVHYIMQANQAKNLFNFAISDSGNSLAPWAINRNAKQTAFQVANFASIKLYENTTTELVRRLRWMGYKKLQEASAKFDLLLEHNWNGLVWAPCKEDASSPNAVITGNSYERLEKGDFNQVPLLTGFNSNEMRVIFAPNPIANISSSYFMQNINNLVPTDMNYNPKNLNIIANEISYFYFGSNTTASNSNFSKYASDNMFVRPIHKTAQLMSKYSPVYLYRYAYTGGVGYQNFSIEGLGHGGELEFIFNIPQKTEEANLTAKRTRRLWTNFAKYGNPTPNDIIDPLIGMLWPNFTTDGNSTYMNIDSNLTIRTNPEPASMQFWDQLYNVYGNQPFDTYKK